MTIKIVCVCGQKYAFDVEPYQGRMPAAVACPVCGVDGTARANEIMARQLAAAPPPPLAAAASPPRMAMPVARPPTASAAPAAPAVAAVTASTATAARAAVAAAVPAAARVAAALPRAADEDEGPGGRGDTWKWWYYIVAGIGIGGYSIWQAYDQQRLKPLGELFLAGLLIAIGVWDFQRKRRKRA